MLPHHTKSAATRLGPPVLDASKGPVLPSATSRTVRLPYAHFLEREPLENTHRKGHRQTRRCDRCGASEAGADNHKEPRILK